MADMGNNAAVAVHGALKTSDRASFAELCSFTKAQFSDAIDLVLIHNERDVSGNQPRRALNPWTVVLAVAGWERFVVDVSALASEKWMKPGFHTKIDRIAYLDSAVNILGPASGGSLPGMWEVRAFSSWRGKSPQGAKTLTIEGSVRDSELAEDVGSWINLRNKVAHNCLPQDANPYWWSDAASHTIQSGQARAALAELLQLTDQAILAIATAAGFSSIDRLRFPREWFAAELPEGARGVTEPGALWGGHSLLRP